MKTLTLPLKTLLLVGGLACPPAQAELVLDLAGVGLSANCSGCGNNGTTLGYGFTLSTPLSIDGLGFWDSGAPGINTTVRTGLWNSSGSLLAAVDISDASSVVASANASGRWLFEDIAELNLAAGSYRIGSLFFDPTPLAQVGTVLTTLPGFTFDGGMHGTNNGGFSDPASAQSFLLIGPTLRSAAVPEPGVLALVGLGLVGIGLGRRKWDR